MLTLPQSTGGMCLGYYSLSMSFTGTTDSIGMPSGITSVSVAVHPQAGQTARIEATLSQESEIAGGTAKWVPWPPGDVSTSTQDSMLTKATALRAVTSGGTAKLEIIAT